MDAGPWPGVYRHGRDLFTENLDPGHRTYGEDLRHEGDREFRRWDPFRSKLAGWLLKQPPPLPEGPVRSVLYLGGAHGTTVSHLSDLWPSAEIFVVEKSPTVFAPLLALARRRTNLLPLLADAQLPERYAADVGRVDLLYQDVAQRDQTGLFLENARVALRPGGTGLLMLKVRSVTHTRPVGRIVAEARSALRSGGFPVGEATDLRPYSKEHAALAFAP